MNLSLLSHNSEETAKSIRDIPQNWSLTPVKGKKPYRDDWNKEDFISHSDIENYLKARECTGFGLRSGEASNGLLVIDVDGSSAKPLLDALGAMPATISWTSGKSGRFGEVFQIPDKYREQLKNFNRKSITEFQGLKAADKEAVEYRYNLHQSVLPPSYHPETDSYKWINSPKDKEVAIAPDFLCEYLVSLMAEDKPAKKNIDINNQENLIEDLKGLSAFVHSEIIPKLSLSQQFPGFVQDSICKHDILGTPGYRESESKRTFSITDKKGYPAFKDYSEDIGGDVITYYHRMNGCTGNPVGQDFINICKQLGSLAGVELPKLKKQKITLETEIIDGIENVIHPENNPDYSYRTDIDFDFKSSKPIDPLKVKKLVTSRKLTPDLIVECNEVDFSKFEQEDGYIYVIAASKGGGKSVAARKNALSRQTSNNIYSISTTFRRKLVKQEVAEKQNLGMIVANFSEFDQSQLIPENTHLVGCTESLKKLEGRAYKYDGYFDEFSAIVKQLLSGGTVKGSERSYLQKVIAGELRAYKRAFIMDADISDVDVEMLRELAPNKKIKVIEFRTVERPRVFKFLDGLKYDKSGEIELKKANKSALFVKILDKKCKPFVVTDTQGFKIETLLNQYDKVGFLINSDTSANYPLPLPSIGFVSGETWTHLFERLPATKNRFEHLVSDVNKSWVEEMMSNPAEFIKKYQPDYFIGSPSITAGFSVVLPGYFSCIAGIFCGLLRTQSLSQILFRLRDNNIDTYVSIADVGLITNSDGWYDNDLGRIINERRLELAKEFESESSEDIIKNAIAKIDPIWEQRSLLEKGLEYFEKNNYRACLRFELESTGHKVEFVTALVDDLVADGMKEIAKADKERIAEEIYKAQEYPERLEQAKELHEKLETLGTKNGLIKAGILDRLPGIQNTEIWSQDFILECFVKNRNFIKQQENFFFVHNPEINKKKIETALYNSATAEHVDGENFIQKDYHVIKALQVLEIPKLIQFLLEGNEISKKSPEVIQIVVKARKITKINQLAGLRPGNKTENCSENIPFISEILKIVGISLKSLGDKKCKDGRYRIYGIDHEKYNHPYRFTSLECINQRWADWVKDEYETDKPDWDFTKNNDGLRKPQSFNTAENNTSEVINTQEIQFDDITNLQCDLYQARGNDDKVGEILSKASTELRQKFYANCDLNRKDSYEKTRKNYENNQSAKTTVINASDYSQDEIDLGDF